MKLKSCYIENFGKLHQFHYEFQDGVNRMIAENGWGKTTFAAFLKAMLFGMEYHTGKKLVDRKKYAPWNHQKFGGYLIFEQGGQTYKIERFFGKKEKDDTYVVYDLALNRQLEGLEDSFGENLWKIDRDTFEKTAFLSLGENELLNEIIAGKLGKEKNQEVGIEESADAVDLLEKQLRKLKALRGNGGILQQVQEQNRYLNQEIRLLKEELKRLQESTIKICIWNEQEQQEWNLYQSLLQNGVPTVEEMDQCHQWLTNQQNQPQIVTGKWKSWIPVALLGCLLLMLGIVVGVLPKILSMSLIIAGIGILFLSVWKMYKGFYLIRKRDQDQLQHEKLQEEIENFFRPYRKYLEGANEDALLRLRHLVQEYQIMNARYEQAVGSEQAQISRRRRDLEEQIQEKENQLSQSKEKEERLLKTYQLLTISKEAMIQAKNQFSARFLIPLKKAFQLNLREMRAMNWESYEMDIQLHLQIEEYGELHDQAFLSKGTCDLLELCLRFALVDAIYSEKEAPILILDDPFINLDDRYLEAANDFIEKKAKQYQMIYFTCHKSRY